MFTSDMIRRALEEDIGSGDVTSEAIVPESLPGYGVVLAKQELVVAGLGVACGVFLTLDPATKLRSLVSDGDRVPPGSTLLTVEGNYRVLLKGERTALNFLQRLCGIATLTRRYVDRTAGTGTRILDTRKTLPGFRALEKYAVRMGGGTNHRKGLYDAVLIKDNHLAAFGGDAAAAVAEVRRRNPGFAVTVEVTRPGQVEPAIAAGARRLLLDNMGDDDVRASVLIARGRAEIEVSGGVTLERVGRLAAIGVDFISVGALTHSAPAVDVSFEVRPS